MEKIDKSKYGNRLRDYLDRRGVQYTKQAGTYRYACPNPAHVDEDPSAVLYENAGKGKNDYLWCASCPGGKKSSYDIFAIAGFYLGSDKFPEQVEEINRTLGIAPGDVPKSNEIQPKKKSEVPKKNTSFVRVTREQASEIYTSEKVLELAVKSGWGDSYSGYWPAIDNKDRVMGVEFRFEGLKKKNGDPKKTPMLIWWNGKNLKSKNPPLLIFGLHELAKNIHLPIVVVEGPKPWNIAKETLGENFNFLTWNGGSKKLKFIDWSFLNKITTPVYFFPDDDEPGSQAAIEFQEIVPRAIIIDPIPEAREIKKEGADIEEALQVFGSDRLITYITSFSATGPSETPIQQPETTEIPPLKLVAENDYIEELPPIEDFEETKPDENELPFRVLGVADDGQAYFIDLEERMLVSPLESINEKKMLKLASIYWWMQRFGENENKMNRMSWLFATDFLIRITNKRDFDPENIRGRGAWRERDGRICYHDGRHTVGEVEPSRVYVKRTQIDIGLHEGPASRELCEKIVKTVLKMSFEKPIDGIRALAWSVISPFCGALTWRPAALLTGETQSGKTTLVDLVIKKLASPRFFSGMESSPAGIRQDIGIDSCAVVIEEAGDDKQSMIEKKQEYFSIMRQSTSDDSPKAVKGTKNQIPITFRMKSMFLFVAIDPEVEHEADDNRIFQINMIKSYKGVEAWKKLERELIQTMTDDNCRAVRSLAWQKVKIILTMADFLLPIIEVVTKKDIRRSIADSLLLAAYIVVWQGKDVIDEMEAGELVFSLLKDDYIEEKRNQAEDLVDRLLDKAIFCPENRVKRTFRQMLYELAEGGIRSSLDEEYQNLLAQHGIKLMKNKIDIAIANKLESTMEILGRKTGYAKTLKRHPKFEGNQKNVRIAGLSRKCTILAGIIDKIETENTTTDLNFDDDPAYQ